MPELRTIARRTSDRACTEACAGVRQAVRFDLAAPSTDSALSGKTCPKVNCAINRQTETSVSRGLASLISNQLAHENRPARFREDRKPDRLRFWKVGKGGGRTWARTKEALPILGKFALLGDVRAQGAIGGMFYFGKGLPLDRDERIRWLQLAARQGGLPERQALSAALSGAWEWDDSSAKPGMAYAPSAPQAPQYAPTLPVRTHSRNGPGYDASMAYGTSGTISPTAPMGARASVEQAYGSGSASRRYSDALGTAPQIGAGSPVILNRAGPGTYSNESGDIYTQAGPHGVVNTRTGEFSPTN